MSKGNLSNTKIRSQLRKNKNDKGKNFYVSKNVSYNPASNVITYEVEGKTKTATLTKEAAKNYMMYFRRCTNGYALDYLVKHQFKLNESTYRVLKLSTRFSTPAEIGEYVKSIEQKFAILERKCPQSRVAAVKFVHQIVSAYFEKKSNSKISIVHDLFFPDIIDISTTTGLIGGKEVKVFASPYVDCVNYTTYVDNDYRTDKLIKVEFKGGNNVSYDYFPAMVCQNLYNKAKGGDVNRQRNMTINQIRGIIIASKEELKKNIANSTFFPYITDSYFKAGINSVYKMNPTDEILGKEVNMDTLFETMNYSPGFGWFNETNDYNNKIDDWGAQNKYEGKDAKTIYTTNYANNLYFSGYDEGSAKLKAISAAIFYTIKDYEKDGKIYDVSEVLKVIPTELNVKNLNLVKRAIDYSINNGVTYDLSEPIEGEEQLVDSLFKSDGSPKNYNVALTFITKNASAEEKQQNMEVLTEKFYDEKTGGSLPKFNIEDLFQSQVALNKAIAKYNEWLTKDDSIPNLTGEEEEQTEPTKQITATDKPTEEKKEETKQDKKEDKSTEDKTTTDNQQTQPAEETKNDGLSRRKLKKMGLSKRQIKKIMRIVDKPKGGVTENDTLNEIKELLKVMVGQVKPSAVNVGDKPVDKLTTTVKKPVDKNVQFNPSDVLGQRERLRPTTTVKYEPPKEFNLKSEIEEFDRDKLNHTMQGLAKVLKKGDITKQKSVIKKFKINPITAHLIKMVGTNQSAKKYMGGVFSKLASLLPYGSQIYDVAKRVYKVAKPVIEKVISKYDTAYNKKMNGYLSKNQLKSYLIKNEKPKLKTLNKILK